MQELRQKHLKKKLEGTICKGCLMKKNLNIKN